MQFKVPIVVEIPVSKGAQEIVRIPMDATGKIIGDPVPIPATINGDIARVELSTFSALVAVETPNFHSRLKPGINLAGQCKTATCIAHLQEVTYHYGTEWEDGAKFKKGRQGYICSACKAPFKVEKIHLFRCIANVTRSSDDAEEFCDLTDPQANTESFKPEDVSIIETRLNHSFFFLLSGIF